MKRKLIMILCLGFSLHTFSQKTIGFEAGTSFSIFNVKNSDNNKKLAIGPRIGINYQRTITPRLDFETGLFYIQKGEKSKNHSQEWILNGSDYEFIETSKFKFNYLQLPLNLKFGIGNWFISSGFYLSYGVQQNYIYKKKSMDINTGEISRKYMEKEYLSGSAYSPYNSSTTTEPWDYGVDFGFGYKLNKFQFKAGIDFGLNEVMTIQSNDWHYSSDPVNYKNRSAYLSVAYQFKNFDKMDYRHADTLFNKQKGFIFNLQFMPWDANEFELAAILGYKYKKLIYFTGYERYIFTYKSTDSFSLKAGIYVYPHKNLRDFKVYYQSFLTYQFIDTNVLVGNLGLGFDYFFIKKFAAGLQFSYGYGKYLESNPGDDYGAVIDFSFAIKYFLIK